MSEPVPARFPIQFDGQPPPLENMTKGARVILMIPDMGRCVRTVFEVAIRRSNVVRLHPLHSDSKAPDLIVNLLLAIDGKNSARVAPSREKVCYLRAAA